MSQVRVAIAVSGAGRSLQNFLKKQKGYEVAAVISSSEKAGANAIAAAAGLPVLVADFSKPDSAQLESWLRGHRIDWIALAGFLKPFPSLSAYDGRIVNIHPALLPAYGGKGMYGMHVHRAVFAAKELTAGATIHFVNESYDDGRIIAQARVPTAGCHSAESLAERIFGLESELYPRVLEGLCDGRLPLKSGAIWIMGDL